MVFFRKIQNKEEGLEYFSNPNNHWIKFIGDKKPYHLFFVDELMYYTPVIIKEDGFFIEVVHGESNQIFISYEDAFNYFASAITEKVIAIEVET